MSEFPNLLQTEHIKAIATLENKVDTLEHRVDTMAVMKDTLIELKALSKEQTTYNKKFNEMYEKSIVSNTEFSLTLKNINENLNSLNTQMKGTNERIDEVEVKIDNIDDKGKVDFLLLIKQYAIPVIMGGGIVYFILNIVGKI